MCELYRRYRLQSLQGYENCASTRRRFRMFRPCGDLNGDLSPKPYGIGMLTSKIVRILLLFILAGLHAEATYAQGSESAGGQKSGQQEGQNPLNHAVFVEALGNAGLISLNYELGIRDRVAVRAGIGTIILFISYPVTASYLVGDTNHRLELGAGATIVKYPTNADGTTIFGSLGKRASFATAIVGYRYQPEQGFLFRVGFTPLMNTEGFFPLGGVSVGFRL